MTKKININTVSRKALRDLLPSGAQPRIVERLAQKGITVSLPTVTRALNPELPLTLKRRQVIEEAIALLEEFKVIHMSADTAEELTQTGS